MIRGLSLNRQLAVVLTSWVLLVAAVAYMYFTCSQDRNGCGGLFWFAFVPGLAMWLYTAVYLINVIRGLIRHEKVALLHKIGFFVVLALAFVPGAGPLWNIVTLMTVPF